MTRAIVVRLDNDGDVLLAGPAVRAVAADTEVTFVCGLRGVQAARLLPGVARILTFTAPWIDPEPAPVDQAAIARFVDEVRSCAADEAIVLTSFHQSALPTALLLRMAGVRTIAAVSEDYPGSLLDVRHRVADDVHEVERALSVVATLGHRLPTGDDGSLEVVGVAAQDVFTEPYVVVHPTASVPARAWSPERNAALVDALVALGWHVAVTGTTADAGVTAGVAGRPRPQVRDLTGVTDFAALASVIAGADAIVVGNTGPAHLAAAVGTPVVSLYAPTVPAARWAPYRVPCVVLGDQQIACAGCRARECPVAGHPCLSSVSVADAVAAVRLVAGRRMAVTACAS
jgi:ADP-heptose:LPS heptosyltransferase